MFPLCTQEVDSVYLSEAKNSVFARRCGYLTRADR